VIENLNFNRDPLLKNGGFFYRKGGFVSGVLIYLNGPSSAGKTSIVHALQDLMQEPYLHVSIDIPRRFYGFDGADADQGFKWVNAHDEKGPMVVFTSGLWGAKLITGMYRAHAGLVTSGNNVVMDAIILWQESLIQAVWALEGLRVYFVGVRAPLEILEERERVRGDRALGMARGQHKIVHDYVYKYGSYDLEIDTSLHTSQECALIIKKYIDEYPKPEAFEKLCRVLQ
jgi:chloramphenicol 3-O phosphotransferase